MLNSLSIRWKILIGLLALAILPMLVLTYLFNNMTTSQVRAQMDLVADQAGRFIMHNNSHMEMMLMEDLTLMAKDNDLLNAVYFNQLTGDSAQLQTVMINYLTQLGIDQLKIIHVDGHSNILDSGSESGLMDLKPTDGAPPELTSSKQSRVTKKDGQLAINGVIPLRLKNSLVGNLVGNIYIDDKMAEQFQMMTEADLAFHDGQRVVASSLDELRGVVLEDLLHEDAVVMDLQGRSHIVYNYPLNHPEAGVLLALDRSSIIAASESLTRTLTMATILVIITAAVLGVVISRGIARPLNTVVQNLREIAAGEADLTQSLKVTSQDEVGLLAGSFNSFIARLRNLVQRTLETTGNLSRATENIRDRFSEVRGSAVAQTQALENSHRGITEIGKSSSEVADSVSNLVASVQQSAAATHELESTTHSIAEQMENLFGIISDISSSIHQLSSSNEQIDGNIVELSNSARETSHAAEGLETATSAIEKSAEQTSQLAQQATSQALEGKAAVQDTIRGISGLQQLIEQAHTSIQELGQRSDAIGSIINVISEVADQTNLLALNAAIIAAQAGEHGQGFAVVAEEIRSLAERTTTSTKEITEIIESLQQGTQDAIITIEAGSVRAHQEVARSYTAGDALEKLHASSLTSTEQITGIAQQTQKQSEENRKITQSVLGITTMLEQIALSISQQTASTRNLSTAAESMKNIAARVKNSTSEQGRGSQQIAKSMEHIQQMIEVIDNATRQQSQRSKEVVESVAMVRQIAEENAERAADMDAVVEELSEQANELQTEMGAFKV